MELVRGIKITDYCDQANLSTKGDERAGHRHAQRNLQPQKS